MKNKPTIFFTLPHNNPSGGVKVVNEFVNLCIEKGYKSYLCLPSDELKSASFLNESAPIISLEDMTNNSTINDIIILGWQSKIEYEAVKNSKANIKVLWQHGILIPNKEEDAGDLVYKEKVISQFWNVSQKCGDFIQEKYNLNNMHIVNPFFDINKTKMEKSGFLLLNRRGAKYIPKIKECLKNTNQSLTILNEPYDSSHFLNLLKIHKYFISIDNGLSYSLTWRQRLKGKSLKWIKHDKNYLGFPVPPVEAALSKTIVIGFAMGGGLEWMTKECMFLSEDDNIDDLILKIRSAVNSNKSTLDNMLEIAYIRTLKFNKENSWKQLKSALNI